MNRLKLFLLFFVFINLACASNELKELLYHESSRFHFPLHYKEAKRILFNELFAHDQNLVEDIYCGRFYPQNSGAINVEHSWPKSRFNKRISRDVQASDLHHLYPVDAQVNSHRGNDLYAEVDGGAINPICKLSKAGRALGTQSTYAFEPPDQYKGDIARGHFYFSIRYKVEIDFMQEAFLRSWNHQDPVSDKERARNDLIEVVQGNRNPFVDDSTLVGQISNF